MCDADVFGAKVPEEPFACESRFADGLCGYVSSSRGRVRMMLKPYKVVGHVWLVEEDGDWIDEND